MLKKLLCTIVSLFLIFSMAGVYYAEPSAVVESAETAVSEPYIVPITGISKHGNVKLNTSFEEMNSHGFEVADIISVSVGDDIYDMPIGTYFTDVDTGEMICQFDKEKNEVELSVNMGSFAEETGLGEKKTIDEDPGFEWDMHVDKVGLSMKEKQGYRDQYDARNLTRSNNREDYPELTDEEYANFRTFCVESTKDPVFYRSSSPLNPELARNEYVMKAMENAGIRTVINLDDAAEAMAEFSIYPDSYYSKCKIVNPQLNYDFGSEEFGGKVKDSLVFIIENDGPYLIHCKEGKDRTGVLCALLESLAGESMESIKADYMETFKNFYHVQPGDKVYDIILNTNLLKILRNLYQVDDLETADLQTEAQEYFLDIGLTQEQIEMLKARLHL